MSAIFPGTEQKRERERGMGIIGKNAEGREREKVVGRAKM